MEATGVSQGGHVQPLTPRVKPSGTTITMFEIPGGEAPVGPFKVARVSVPTGGSTDPDTHEVREFWMIARGAARLVYAGEELRVNVGDVVFFDSNRTHQLFNDGAETVEFFAAWWNP